MDHLHERTPARGSSFPLPLHHRSRCLSSANLQECVDSALEHPLLPRAPCPVLQYADDTLILVKGDMRAVQRLKQVLDSFSAATGLTINYHKSTFIPMSLADNVVTAMSTCLGCSVSTFPQPYLGLPLSPMKLRVSDYQPLIASFDQYLPVWKAHLLDVGARLLLTNSVLGSLPVYWMSSLLLPKQ